MKIVRASDYHHKVTRKMRMRTVSSMSILEKAVGASTDPLEAIYRAAVYAWRQRRIFSNNQSSVVVVGHDQGSAHVDKIILNSSAFSAFHRLMWMQLRMFPIP